MQVQDTMGDVNHVVQESINGNAVVKSFAGEESEQERFYKSSEENLKRGLKMVIVQNLNSPVVQVVMACAMALIVWLALRPQILGIQLLVSLLHILRQQDYFQSLLKT